MNMDLESVNPLALTLEEVIKLNRYRNKEIDQQPSSSDVIDIKKEPRDFTNDLDDEELTTTLQDKLRETENGNVFDRLGWKKHGSKPNARNQAALRAIRQAKQFKHRNIRVVHNNLSMPPPLTTSVLRRHNQTPGNFVVKRVSSPGSVHSMSSTSSMPRMYRHSLKNCLDPNIQQVIHQMLDGRPAVVRSANMGQLVVDHSLLKNYIGSSDCTSLPTHARFAMND